MLYLSQLLGAPVEDSQGARVGQIIDILIAQEEPAPRVTLLVEVQDDHLWNVPVESVEWHDNVLRFRTPVEQLSTQPAASSSQVASLQQNELNNHVNDL